MAEFYDVDANFVDSLRQQRHLFFRRVGVYVSTRLGLEGWKRKIVFNLYATAIPL